MCGIAGKLNFNGARVNAVEIRRMTDEIRYRGPDDDGIYTDANVGLGQRRLSVIDLRPEATAPLANEDGTIWIVYNGEVYNFEALRDDLRARGHAFRTNTDTEVIVHLYEEYGIDCLAKLRGMFAFAIWDSTKQILFAARDRIGKKPFVYSRTPTSFVFASTINALVADPDVSRNPNYVAIDNYLTFQYVPHPQTAFENIHKLPAAHYLICNSTGEIRISRYWSASDISTKNLDVEDYSQGLRDLLTESVKLRMIADVPLGAFLSGGVDSGVIVALMAMQSATPIKTFTIGFEDDSHDERPYARLVADRYKTDHHEFVVQPDAAALVPELVRHYGEPFADSSAIPTYYVAREARKVVTVALSGDGGDENFAGYQKYTMVRALGTFDSVPGALRKPLLRSVAKLLEYAPHGNATDRARRVLRLLASDLGDRYENYLSIVKDEEKAWLYTKEFKHRISWPVQSPRITMTSANPQLGSVDWMMMHDLEHYLVDCLMVKTDIASMANSLEVRCPILDHNVIEFARTIPVHYKIKNNAQKWIFKETFKNLLPDAILTKKKTGFAVPLASWLRTGTLNTLLTQTLLDAETTRRGIFEPKAIQTMVAQHCSGTRDWANRLWSILMLELWFREFC